MKKVFVALGFIGFIVFSLLILLTLGDFPSSCYGDILNCKTNVGLVLFLGCFWILSLASFVGGITNSETE